MNKDILLYNRLQAYKLNLHTLSERSGVSYSTVYNLFTGRKRISDASGETLCNLARFLGMTMDEMYHELNVKDTDSKIFPDFLLMWKDEVIASVTVGENEVNIDRYVIHPVKQIFYADKISRFKFGEILKLRCWDEKRPDIKELLNAIGLENYNPYEICKKTHGRMVQDPIWFKFEGETLTYRSFAEKRDFNA